MSCYSGKVFLSKKGVVFGLLAVLSSCRTSVPVTSPGSAVQPQTPAQLERQEFLELWNKDSLKKRNTAAVSLNVFLGDNPNEKMVSVMVKNTSDCDVILRLSGGTSYSLPIRKKDKNFLRWRRGSIISGQIFAIRASAPAGPSTTA